MNKCKYCNNPVIDDKHPYCYPCNNSMLDKFFTMSWQEMIDDENLHKEYLDWQDRCCNSINSIDEKKLFYPKPYGYPSDKSAILELLNQRNEEDSEKMENILFEQKIRKIVKEFLIEEKKYG